MGIVRRIARGFSRRFRQRQTETTAADIVEVVAQDGDVVLADCAEPDAAHSRLADSPGPEQRGGRRGPSAVAVILDRDGRRALQVLLRRERTPWAVACRARVILALAADADSCVAAVAAELGHDRKYVRKWRDRYQVDGIDALKGRARTGRPVSIGPVSRCKLISMACAKPVDFGVRCRAKWTVDSLTAAYGAHAEAEGLDPMSRTSVVRALNDADLRPHRVKMWLHSPDPQFREKVTEICDVYFSALHGKTILCIDEKTGIQALGRKHPCRGPEPGRDARMDYEYVRNGTRKLLACWDVGTGEVYGEMRKHRKAVDLVEFMEEVARRYPTGDVHIVWDNLNIHYDGKDKRWTKFNQRHGGRFHFHYTPIHASWVNQIELWFGILQRRIIEDGVFNSLEELDVAVLGFIAHWNEHERKPFKWTFKGYPMQTGLAAA